MVGCLCNGVKDSSMPWVCMVHCKDCCRDEAIVSVQFTSHAICIIWIVRLSIVTCQSTRVNEARDVSLNQVYKHLSSDQHNQMSTRLHNILYTPLKLILTRTVTEPNIEKEARPQQQIKENIGLPSHKRTF